MKRKKRLAFFVTAGIVILCVSVYMNARTGYAPSFEPRTDIPKPPDELSAAIYTAMTPADKTGEDPLPVLSEQAPQAEKEPPQEAAEEKTKLLMPVSGEITRPYSEKPVYSKTMRDWRTHRAIDISAPQAERVLAASDGVVKRVRVDPAWGITIEIAHENGLTTVYKSLSTDKMVKEGDRVRAGDAISGVGTSAVIESGDPAHLHFEVLLGENPVNPEDYF